MVNMLAAKLEGTKTERPKWTLSDVETKALLTKLAEALAKAKVLTVGKTLGDV